MSTLLQTMHIIKGECANKCCLYETNPLKKYYSILLIHNGVYIVFFICVRLFE